MPTPDEIKKEKVEKKKKPTTKPKDPPKPVSKELANIGKGYFARDAVDPYQRLTNYLWTRMHMVDILPCNFEMPFVRSPESALESLVKAFTPKIRYSERMLEYETQCFKHGLPRKSGVRLWITNETQTDEQFDVSYEDSMFQNAIDGMSQLLRPLRQIGRSMSSGLTFGGEKIDKAIGPGVEKAEDALGKLILATYGLTSGGSVPDAEFKNKASKILDNVGELTKVLGQVVLKGNRITFPKVWQNTTYGQQFTCAVKLASPYGTPRAITKYIVRPLLYLLLLASPKTEDGISFGDNHPLSIHAYGLGWFKLGAIKSLTIRRGGNDGMFNVFRQPLMVDVNLTFQNLIEGFAVFDEDHAGLDLLNRANTFIGGSINSDTQNNGLLTDVTTFVDSFRPLGGSQDRTPAWEDYKNNMGKFNKAGRQVYPEASENQLTVGSDDLPLSVADEAIQIVREAAPNIDIPDDITVGDLISLVEALRTTDIAEVYNEIKSRLYQLVINPIANIPQVLLDYVRQTATETINDIAESLADSATEAVISALPDKMPDVNDLNPFA